MDADVSLHILRLVDRHFCAAHVRTMPHGIDEALFPRFSSQEGREIVPVLTREGARELAVRTPIPRLLLCGGKTDDLSAKRCVADKDPFFSRDGSGHPFPATTLAYE